MTTIHTIRERTQANGDPFYELWAIEPDEIAPRRISYGSQAEMIAAICLDDPVALMENNRFCQEIAARQMHSLEMMKLLERAGEAETRDLSQFVIYGSFRPWSSHFIPESVGVPCNIKIRGWHCWSYVLVPEILDQETVEHYNLIFVSAPAGRPLVDQKSCLSREWNKGE